MGLSIKDAETEALVRKLASRRGTSMTGAIKLAVSNELERDDVAAKQDFETLWADIQRIQREYAALGETMTSAEADAWMYDENGLPH